jgi:hypothetical protein
MSDALVTAMGASIAFIVWLIRLEGKVKTNAELLLLRLEIGTLRQNKLEKDHDDLVKKVEALSDKILDKLSLIEKHLGNIEGRLTTTEQRI